MPTSEQPPDLSPAAAAFAEFLSERSEGGPADFERFCARRPDLAPKLRRLYRRWRELDDALKVDDEQGVASLGFTVRSGERYEVRAEIARGGMGSVHEAWDRQLRRTLAMKILHVDDAERGTPSSPGTDPRSLSRFLDEAQIMGQLDHPGVVPVHEIGMDEQGRIYFTMPLVRGSSFKEIIDRVHEGDAEWTRPRALGVLSNVCDTVAFAHAKGVIHRDLKPSNVMVGRFGETYVMDWGLARSLGREDKKDIRLREMSEALSSVRSNRRDLMEDEPDSPLVTMDGDVVGTPAYMPPEQARGLIDEVGPRADVYAVGAMLYHLLAGSMPYVPKGSRVSARTVLAQVLHGPPKPLHASNARAPSELVAICDKAMAREPDDRYADMAELAADLRAFLELRVVRAFRGGPWVELSKWVRRNRGLASTAAVAVLALAVGLVLALVEKRRADHNATVAGQEARRADQQAERAEEHFAMAFDAVERMLERVGSKDLEGVPRARAVQRALLEDALEFYEAFLRRRADDPTVRRKVARTHYLVASAKRELGDSAGAQDAAERAIQAYEALCREEGDQPELCGAVAAACTVLANAHASAGRYDEAEACHRRSLAWLDRAGGDGENPRRLRRRANIHSNLGLLHSHQGRADLSIDELRRSIAISRELIDLESSSENRAFLAARLHRLGYALNEARRQDEGKPVLEEAVSTFEQLLETDPDDESLRRGHAFAMLNLGVSQSQTGDRATGLATRKRTTELFRGLVSDYPSVPDYRIQLATSLANVGSLTDDLDEALKRFDESALHRRRALEMVPEQAQFREHAIRQQRQLLMKLAGRKEHRALAERVDALPAYDPGRADLWRSAGAFLAYCVKFAKNDASLSDDERRTLVDEYTGRVVEHLRAAVERGWHDVSYFDRSHFAPLRDHPVFRAFVAELER